MRTLILLPASDDEIYFVWPALRALKRNRLDGEIHLVLAQGSGERLPPHEGFLIHVADTLDTAMKSLAPCEFDEIFNLSFSKEGRELTARLTGPRTRVCGCTSHADGTLAIPDDSSAYVYAQTGPGRPNRYHRTAIYAAIVGVELTDQDLYYDRGTANPVFAGLNERLNGATALTTTDETEGALASLMGVPVLFIGREECGFWEKGPWSPKSRVVVLAGDQVLDSEAREAHLTSLCLGHPPPGPCWLWEEESRIYSPYEIADDGFDWALLQALYTDADYPPAPDQATSLGFQRLLEISELVVNTLDNWEQNRGGAAAAKVALLERMLEQIPDLAPRVAPVLRWFQTEFVRLGPSSEEVVRERTRKLYGDLFLIASVYNRYGDMDRTREQASRLCQSCGPAFREWEISTVVGDFQKLVASFQELARHSSRLGERQWSEILGELVASFDRHDYVDVADQIEFVIAPKLL
jgi:hypothetical protein